MGEINGRNLHFETIYHGKPVIIDASYIGNMVEVMCMDATTYNEIESIRVDEDEAQEAFAEMRYRYKDQPHAALKGKYEKLRKDLATVIEAGWKADSEEDGGTCNFDAPAIQGNRWIESMVVQAARENDLTVWKWKPYSRSNTWYVFGVPGDGQANRRTRKADAMTKAFKDLGYEAFTYSSMD